MTALASRAARPMGAVGAIRRLLRHQLMRSRRVWWSTIVSGLANPTVFLFAIGAGLGSQIDDTELARLGTDSYLQWIGPGVLAVTAMDIGAREGLWPTMTLIKWQPSYLAVLHTPMSAGQIGAAHVAWIALRGVIAATCFLGVLAIAGVVTTWWALTVPLLAGAIAAAHGGPLAAFTAAQESENSFAMIQRLVVFPLFLFSGAFFPIDELPAGFSWAARVLPSWHGVEATRDLVLGQLDAATIGHVALLVALTVAGVWLSARSFRKNLIA